MSSPSTVFSQEEIGDLIELPEDAIIAESDPFSYLTPSDAIWRGRSPATFDDNMGKAGIFHLYSTGQIGAVEAFRALEVRGLVHWDDLLWMLMVNHRTAEIIEGKAP